MAEGEEALNDQRMGAIVQPFLHPDFFFVNVGAFDGIANDPIYALVKRYAWRGIAVEPSPPAFRRLEEAYRRVAPQVALVNATISDVERPIWYVPEGQGAIWDLVGQWSSTDRKSLENYLGTYLDGVRSTGKYEQVPELEGLVQRADLRCVTFNDLMAEHQVDHVDLLNIDAEGSDLEILLSIDLDRYCPSVLCIEVATMTRPESSRMRTLLSDYGLRRAFTFEPFSTVFVRG